MRASLGLRLGAFAVAAGLAGCAATPEPPRPVTPTENLPVDAAAAARLVSAYRQSLGLSPVSVDPALVEAARRQAVAMASADELSHDIDGSLSTRLRARRYAVENVSAGYATLEAAMAGWRHSPAHDANLRDPRMRRLGIAAAQAPDTRYKTFWSLDMTD